MTIGDDRSYRSRLRDSVLDTISRVPYFKGRDIIGNWLAKILNFQNEPIALARLHCGSRVYVDLRCPDHWNAFVFHTYDSRLVRFIQNVLRHPGCVFMDIGASVGLVSMGLAPHINALNGRILAYEPYAGNRNMLLKSIAQNGFSDMMDVFPFALGSRSGYVSLTISEATADVGNAVIVGEVLTETDEKSDTKMITLDEHVLEIGLDRLDCIKIDVEGFELEVLIGACKALQRFKPIIFSEFNTEFMRCRGVDLDAAWALLLSMSYDLQQYDEGSWKQVFTRPEQKCWDLRMVPASL